MRFSVGFGRVLWRRQASPQATEFVVCMLPLGGYVRMLDDREGPIDPAQSHQAFNRKPLWQRAFVVFAGPAANLLLAVFLYSAVQWMGVLEPQAVLSAPPAQSVAARAGLKSGDWVRAWSADGLSWQEVRSMVDLRWRALDARVNGKPLYLMVSDSQGRGSRAVRLDAPAGSRSADPEAMRELGLGAPWSPAVLGEIKPGGPADQAGLRAGDKVVTVDGLPIQDAQALREAIQARPGQTSTWIVLRTEGTVQVEVRPRTQRAGQGTVGKIDAFVGLAAPTVMVSMGPLDGLIEGVNKTWDVSVLTVSTIGRMIVGQASIKNLSGPLTIADYAGQSAQKGWSSYLAFLALVSVSLGILNLLPLPMLDGGHLMYYLFEGLTGRPVSDAWLERLQRGGIAILLTLMSVALFNDVARLVGFH
jgi:regulator of sigma E protease